MENYHLVIQKKMKTKKQPKKLKFYSLDLACGNNKQKGFIGVDFPKKGTQADIEHDLLKFPWPFKDNSVDSMFCSHFLEHIPHGNDGHNDPFFQFFDEVYRVLKPGGTFQSVTPYYMSGRAFQDPTHQRFITEATFLYLTKDWRKLNKLEHYPVSCNFTIEKIDHAVSEEFRGRSQEAVQYEAQHSWNVVNDILVTLRKPK